MESDSNPKEALEVPLLKKRHVKESFSSQLLKSLIVVGAIAASAVFVNVFFGRASFETLSRNELIEAIRGAPIAEKEMALQAWARELIAKSDDPVEVASYRPNSEQVLELMKLLEAYETWKERPNIGVTLAVLLGFCEINSDLGARVEALLLRETILNREELAIPLTGLLLHSSVNHSVKMTTLKKLAEALGPNIGQGYLQLVGRMLENDESLEKGVHLELMGLMAKGLNSEKYEVMSLAAIQLLRFGDLRAKGHLEKLYQNSKQHSMSGLGSDERSLSIENLELYSELFRATHLNGDPELMALLKEVSKSAPNVKLREAAKRALGPS